MEGFASLLSFMDELPKTNLISFKEAYEKALADRHGAPLLYNREARSLAQPLLEGRVQCYSGAMLFYALTELAGLTARPRLALFAKGHILPGILRGPEGQQRLYGIETTVQGAGLSDFGLASEVSGEIRIAELYPFLLIELLKAETANFPELFAAAGESLRKLGFSPERLRPLDSKWQAPAGGILSATPFGFGRSGAPSGDRLRQEPSSEKLAAFYNLKRSGEALRPNRSGGFSKEALAGGFAAPLPESGELPKSLAGPPAPVTEREITDLALKLLDWQWIPMADPLSEREIQAFHKLLELGAPGGPAAAALYELFGAEAPLVFAFLRRRGAEIVEIHKIFNALPADEAIAEICYKIPPPFCLSEGEIIKARRIFELPFPPMSLLPKGQ